jgi:outer membrane protein TolC
MRRKTIVLLVSSLFLPALGAAEKPKEQPADRAKLAAAKVEAARTAYKATMTAFREGRSDSEKVYLWSRRWLEAQRDASPKLAERAAAIEAHRQRMKDLRKMAEQNYKRGQAPIADVLGADFYIAEADLWLSDAQRAD